MTWGIRGKLLAGFGVVLALFLTTGVVGVMSLSGLADDLEAMYTLQLEPLNDVAKATLLLERINTSLEESINAGSTDERETDLRSIATLTDDLEGVLREYRTDQAVGDPAIQPILAQFDKAYAAFVPNRVRIIELARAGEVDAADEIHDDSGIEKALAYLEQLQAFHEASAAAARDAGRATFQRQLALTAGLLGLGLALGVGIAFSTARSMTRSVGRVADAARQIARDDLPSLLHVARALAAGDLTQDAVVKTEPVDVRSSDEIGKMAGNFNEMIGSLQDAGTAFAEMSENLREVIGRVKDSADGVADTSVQLGQAASQTSGVVQQVTQAVQSLAAGSSDTSRSAQTANDTVIQLGQVIDGITAGAAEQSRLVQTVSETATVLATGVEQVASNAQQVASASQQTRASAEHGAHAVRETVASMSEIKQVVAIAAGKVEDLGKLSEKIGAVVETIDDIADQTNLLALNAAIEAARAGEHGRGFAIVADEVRKLAERSQRETKAISELIHQVQTGTQDAVDAMEQGSVKVEQGAARADEAGAALNEILAAVQATVGQVTQIAASAQEMATGAHGVVVAMGSIAAVVEENSAATAQMATQANEATAAIESIAAGSEENSAATEEVSASSEEMSAQVEEMTAQSEELAATAGLLKDLVARFTLDSSISAPDVMVRRRVQDWNGAPLIPSTRRAS